VPLRPVHPSNWDLTPAAARALQERLSGEAESHDRLGVPDLIAGIDVGFEDRGRVTRAAVAVLKFADLQVVESALARRPTAFPYLACTDRYRLPEPSRVAHQLSSNG
jgi:deoxyribonuclease V